MKTIKFKDLAHFTPRQIEFWKAVQKYKFVLYGGAKGGGKSYAIRWILLRLLIRWAMAGHKGVRVGLFCEDYPSLKDRQITKIDKEFPVWLGTLSDSQKQGMSFVLKPEYGSGVLALRNLDDPSKYASSEFAASAIDEITKNNRDVFDQLRSITRWPGIENTKIIGGTNPGGKGNFWVKKLFIDRIFTDEDPRPEDVYFVKSLPTDNPYNAKSYLEELQKLPEKLRKAYYDGNWDVFEGQYFTEWDKEQHIVKPFEIPKNWKKFRSYDYGREKPCCCLWCALDYDGRIYVYREFYKGGLDADQQAKEINRLSTGEEYEYSVADSAIFAKTGVIDKWGHETIAEVFTGNGITFIPASKRRIDGWNLMHQYLRWNEKEKPKLIYFSTCTNSITTIPSLVHSEIRPEDLETDSEDHASDCTRYMLMTLHGSHTEPPKTHAEQKLDEMKKQELNLNNFYFPE